MTVRVVTDSACDVLTQLAQELGITVVPIYVVFGDKSFRDRVDLMEDELYDELVLNAVSRSTSVPSPNDFAEVHNRLAEDTDEIISIHPRESGSFPGDSRGPGAMGVAIREAYRRGDSARNVPWHLSALQLCTG